MKSTIISKSLLCLLVAAMFCEGAIIDETQFTSEENEQENQFNADEEYYQENIESRLPSSKWPPSITSPTTAAPTQTSTTEAPQAVGECNKDGDFLPHKRDNTSFYQCDAMLIPHLLHCPLTLVWNQISSRCESTHPLLEVRKLPVKLSPTSTTELLQAVGECIKDGDFLLHKRNNNSFYQCDAMLIPHLLHCSSNLVWNQTTSRCESTRPLLEVTKLPVKLSPTSTTEAPQAVGECIKDGDFLLHKSDTNSYYQCDAGLIPHLLHCPSNLVWNQTSSRCKSLTSPLPETALSTKLSPISTTEAPQAVGECIKDGDFLPHQTNIHKFYQCDAGLIPHLLTCPSELVWNRESLRCESTMASSTEPTTSSPPPSITETLLAVGNCTEVGEYLPHSTDVHSFYQCAAGLTPRVFKCPLPLVWKQKLLYCEFPSRL